jgi:ubiquinone biosynthesis monooxygenase Coq6
MEVWDGVTGSRIDFDWRYDLARQSGTVAYMNENSNLVQALLARLSELGGCSTYDQCKVSNISLGPPEASTQAGPDLSAWPHLTLSSGKSIATRLLVGADGANSPVRTFAGISARGWDYGRHGVVATLRLAKTPESPITAFQRFLPSGPVAMLPLPGPYATLVWSTTPDRAAHLKSLSSDDFLSMVNAAFRLSPVDLTYMHTMPSGQGEELSWRLQHTSTPIEGEKIPYRASEVQEGSVASFPLRLRHADTYATHRVALVGDAAHTTHPLAGQGLNMGIGDVESLANAVAFAAEHGMDIGDQLSLERYNTERYAANHLLLGVVDKLHKLYSAESGPLVGLRSLGLDAVNKLAPLKHMFMKQAAGE